MKTDIRVINIIQEHIKNYEGLMIDYDGESACISIGWDNFNEDDKKMLMEDDVFAVQVASAIRGANDILVDKKGVNIYIDKKFNHL